MKTLTNQEIIEHVENAISQYGDQLDCVYSYFCDHNIQVPPRSEFRKFVECAGIPVHDLYSDSDVTDAHTYDLCLFVSHF
jgi:hypothetical protein